MKACSRPTRRAVSVTSRLARAKRSTSMGSRTNARTTRMPAICSRSTRLSVSMRFCINRNCGTIWITIAPIAIASTGTATTSSQARPMSSCRARMMPPIPVIGAATSNVQVISTST